MLTHCFFVSLKYFKRALGILESRICKTLMHKDRHSPDDFNSITHGQIINQRWKSLLEQDLIIVSGSTMWKDICQSKHETQRSTAKAGTSPN